MTDLFVILEKPSDEDPTARKLYLGNRAYGPDALESFGQCALMEPTKGGDTQ